MEQFNWDTQSAVWQRVAGNPGPGFYGQALLEGRIMAACQKLYRAGRLRRQAKFIYGRAAARQRAMEALARRLGESALEIPRGGGNLLELLGRAAWGYDPTHPVYGPMLSKLRDECTHDQRLLLKYM